MARPRRSRRGTGAEPTAGLQVGGEQLADQVVSVNRTAKVGKGGRRFNFSAMVVVGNHGGRVGYGFGKAREVADAIRKGTELAKKSLVDVKLRNTTIPHEVIGRFGGSVVLLRPASAGTGIIAGGAVRSVVGLAGIKDVLAKSLGSSNPINVVKATMDALAQLRLREEILRLRGLSSTDGSEQKK